MATLWRQMLYPNQPDGLGFQSFTVWEPLQAWVQQIWSLQVPAQNQPSHHALYPDGGSNLLFEWQYNNLPQVWLWQQPQFQQQLYLPGQRQLSIRFLPAAAFFLLGIEPSSGRQQLAANDVPGLHNLLHQLVTAEQSQQLLLLQQWLLSLIAPWQQRPPLLQRMLPLLGQTDQSLAELYPQLPLSRRQLERQVRQSTGLSPAQLQSLQRVKQARWLLNQHPAYDLSALALACGFYDQSHLHQHFLRITEQTPGQYKKRKMSQFSKP